MAEIKLKEVREQLRGMTNEELVNEVAVQRANLYHMRRRAALRQQTDTAAIRMARKQIARALTLLREREIATEREGK